MLLTHRRVRFRSTFGAVFSESRLTDKFTSQTIESVRGNATRFEFASFDAADAPLDLSEVESLNLKIQPSQTEDGVLADKTLAAVDLDLTLDLATWNDDSKSHAVFDFSNAEMNFAIGAAKKSLWLVVTAITTGGNEVTLTAGEFALHEDNNGSLAEPPENPGAYLTVDQGDARYGVGTGTPTNDCVIVSGASTPDISGLLHPTGLSGLGDRFLGTGGSAAIPLTGNYVSIHWEDLDGWFQIYLWVDGMTTAGWSGGGTDPENPVSGTFTPTGGTAVGNIEVTFHPQFVSSNRFLSNGEDMFFNAGTLALPVWKKLTGELVV